jgi:diphosphomevalonate decarboxylase
MRHFPFKNISGTAAWNSPSNIAIVKYWGKFGAQYPKNPNISFTLSKAYTETEIEFTPKQNNRKNIDIEFLFEGKPNVKFQEKIVAFLESIQNELPYLGYFDFKIKSINSFPHSAGIASSASSMSALALCLLDIQNRVDKEMAPDEFLQQASRIARLGSGSACRSVFPYMAVWGKFDAILPSSNDYAIDFSQNIHNVFKTYKDAILIVSSDEKSVSSRAGHALMDNNIFAEARYRQANQNMNALLPILKSGDVDAFGQIAEQEALTLHALMMCSSPSFMLLHPNTLKIIELIKQFRKENNVSLCFTLDAGPNVHLLYPQQEAQKVEAFVEQILAEYCENGKIIYDEVGTGAAPKPPKGELPNV